MPHIRVRAMTEADIKILSQVLPEALAELMNTPEDNFTLEKLNSDFYRGGNRVDGDPMIEVHWFDRGAEMKSKTADKITDIVRSIKPAEYISVVFFDLPKTNYFENGKHF